MLFYWTTFVLWWHFAHSNAFVHELADRRSEQLQLIESQV